MRVVTVTPNPALDTVTAIEEVEAGPKLRCDAPSRYPGGGGINVTRAMAELGCASRAVWTRGGAMGRLLETLLAEEGVDHWPVPVTDGTRESFMVEERTTGDFYRFQLPGPSLAEEEVAALVERVADARPELVVASGSQPQGRGTDVYPRLAKAASEIGFRLVLDCSAPDLERTLDAAPVYLVKPNYREFGRLTGVDGQDEGALVRAAGELVSSGSVEVVVVTMGESGSMWMTADGAEKIAAPKVEVGSPIGAGDSMTAGLVCGLTREWPLREAVMFGVAAAASAVTTPGTELCRREQTERLYDGLRARHESTRSITTGA